MNFSIDPNVLSAAARLGSATLHEASGKRGALPSNIKPLRSDWRLAATVFTVVGPPKDNLWLHRAIYKAPKGSVLVHECGDADEAGYWGGIMANAAKSAGLAGFVTQGGVRDSLELQELNWPIFAANVCIQGTTKRLEGAGSLGTTALLGQVLVETGDLLVGDADGVVIVKRSEVAQVVDAGVQREHSELEIVKRIRAGETTLGIYKLPEGAA
jgi:4-hydroxy-4-methyl-2-oxoglutarate aldolase